MIGAFLLVAAVICPVPQTDAFVGRWESQQTSKGGIGQIIDFNNDGSYASTTAVIVNLKYSVDGNYLIITDKELNLGQSVQKTQFRVEGDQFIRSLNDDSDLSAKRVKPSEPGQNSVVGVWRYQHSAGGTAYEKYTKDNRLLFRLPMTTSYGCYVPHDNQNLVLLAPQRGEEVTLKFQIDNDLLRLTKDEEGTSVFSKSPWGKWYYLSGQ